MQAERGIASSASDLAILHRGSLSKHGLGIGQASACDVNHRHLKMREREIRVEREHVRRGPKALVAPRRVAEAEEVTPVRRLARGRAPRRRPGFRRLTGAY